MAQDTGFDVTKLKKNPLEKADGEAAAGTDWNEGMFQDPPRGWNTFEVAACSVEPDQTFKWKGEEHPAHKATVRLVVPRGLPNEGASIQDRLPMPIAGKPFDVNLQRRLRQFLVAIGHDIPEVRYMPEGFDPRTMLVGRRCEAKIEMQMEDKKPKLKQNGEPWMQVALFGYRRLGAGNPQNKDAIAVTREALEENKKEDTDWGL